MMRAFFKKAVIALLVVIVSPAVFILLLGLVLCEVFE